MKLAIKCLTHVFLAGITITKVNVKSKSLFLCFTEVLLFENAKMSLMSEKRKEFLLIDLPFFNFKIVFG